MREKLKYFIINKAYDYNRGIYENMKIRGSGLCFHSDNPSGVGRFMTRIFDAGELENSWHRLIIRTQNCDPSDLRVTVYASEKNEMHFRDADITLYDLFDNPGISLEEKINAYKPFIVRQTSGVSDMLLHDVRGQYLWLLIEQYSSGASGAGLVDIRVFLPAVSWIDHLPAIFRSSDSESHFLERYLGIFQTFYEELDWEIEDMCTRFDPESAEHDFLKWIASWLHIRDAGIWTDEQLRRLVMNAVRLYRIRGTKEGLSDIIELYTGEKPFIIEGFNIKEMADSIPNGKMLLEMYGGNPYTVTVLVKPGNDLEVIRRLAQEMMPITAELNLVELDPYIFLNNYAYLGVNSSLGFYRPAVLDGSSQLMLSTLGSSRDSGTENDENTVSGNSDDIKDK